MDIPSSSSSPRDSLVPPREHHGAPDGLPTTRSQESDLGISKLSDSVLLVYDPAEPQVDVVFFHGLQHQHTGGLDVHLSTWTCKHDSKTIWPQRWLQEQRARVLFIKYDASLQKTDSTGRMDLTIIAENLLTELSWAFQRGQESSNAFRPIIFVGHSFGGLVIKQLCIHAGERKVFAIGDRNDDRLLKSIKGILFCGTPHSGSEMLAGIARQVMSRSPLLPFIESLSTEVARQGEKFGRLASKEKWEIFSIGEAFATEMRTGGFHMVTGGISSHMIVKEASARLGPNYITVAADHLSLCKPESKQSNMFQHLVKLIDLANVQQQQVQGTSASGATTQCHARRRQAVSRNPVGTESLLETVTAETEQGRSFIGFSGMGGVGKTTLAKLLYNKINVPFQYACFVDKVKEIPGDKRKVKEEVWKHISPHPGGDYNESRWDEILGKKLLVIFDDVDKRDVELLEEIAQENDAEGSCFVVTSRDEGLFKLFGDQIYICRVPVLGSEHARQLFITHAFPGKNEPLNDLKEIVAEIVGRCDGLPLTLEVIGRLVRGETDKRIWEDISKALQAVDLRSRLSDLEQNVWDKLRVSIDSLGTGELEMFLDTATIFTRPGDFKCFGMRHDSSSDRWFSSEDVMTAWSSMYGSAYYKWQVLINRSLVYSGKMDNSEGEFEPRMHEHLRTLGIRIALEKGRIIKLNPLDGNYKGAQGLDKVIFHQVVLENEYMEYDENCCDEERPCKMRVASSIMSRLEGLRYLVFRYQCLHQPCKRCAERHLQLPPKTTMLRWVSAQTIFVHSTLKELVVLHVTCSHVPRLRQSNPARTSSRGLQNYDNNTIPLPEESSTTVSDEGDFVNLRQFCQLDRSIATPDLLPESCGQLVHLLFYDVPNQSIHGWNLASLERLYLSQCDKLQSLPESFGGLLGLKGLRMSWCSELQALPSSFGNLTNLEWLDLSWCDKLQSLPKSFGVLLGLKELEMRECSELQALPSSFGNLTNLGRLDLDQCHKLQSLPESFGGLLGLKELEMSGCSELQALPSSFGNLTNLEWLDFYGCRKLQSLPESFGGLLGLKALWMSRCSELQALPSSFGNLTNLERLDFCGCPKLQSLPGSFGGLLGLKELEMSGCSELQALPSSFGNLTNLERLDCSHCRNHSEYFLA